MAHLETRNIVKIYGSRTVVDGISLKVDTGTVVGLLGPNGAGKTTTFYSIVGFVKPNEGDVLLNGEVITELPIINIMLCLLICCCICRNLILL